ncbi:hypothetical protein BPUTSESOX_1523 [uncultured Gammaproteobacteria bacterium]|nr:hypothetical protein [uncultured Gammaproteobacteria bacterium]VVH51552.1 hypothetical protein BPUTSESOX_1523 [uncultured Gammaproteobacteria bacterium]
MFLTFKKFNNNHSNHQISHKKSLSFPKNVFFLSKQEKAKIADFGMTNQYYT